MKYFALFLFIVLSFSLKSQVFYTENFDGTACALPGNSGCDPSIVSWGVTSQGAEGANANVWYVSPTETGVNCVGSSGNNTLHIGNVSTSTAAAFFCSTGDCAALYDDTGAPEISNTRAESPTIDCSGQTTITADFNYIESGQGASDDCTFWYFDGTIWSQIDPMAKAGGCSGITVNLPASADNNPNVKIGFLWVNNGDGVAADPPVAIDDITLSNNAAPAPIVAAFSTNPKIGCSLPHTAFFTDASTGPNKFYAWDFGDGGTSNAQNPVHNYLTGGTFVVELTVQDSIIGTTDIAYDTVKVGDASANFAGLPLFGCGPLTVNFTDASTSTFNITSWAWTFGDGGTSTVQNPTYIYQTPGVYNVSLTITDILGCTNINTKTNYVQVIGPDVNFGADQTVICPNTTVNFTDSTIFGAPIVSWTWNFGDGSANSNLQNPSHTYTASGIYTVSLTVTDIDGCSRTFTINNYIDATDIINPVITCPVAVTINTDAGVCNSTAAIGTATATDNCSAAISSDAPATFPIGNTTVTWTATDGAGNTATCTQTVTVVDNENPVITCPVAITINTDAGVCSSTAAIGTATGTDNCGAPTITNDAPATFPIGNTTVTWTATDGGGNTATCTQIVTVIDNETPVITCPVAITINTDAGVCSSTATIGIATGTDNCGAPTITNDAPATFPIGTTTVTWTATDGGGNIATCTQIVTVVDNEDPVITCPSAITINADAGVCTSTASFGTATGTDNCGAPTITNNAPTPFPIGATTVTWTATDGVGNTATCTQIVTVVDAVDPIITCPVDVTINTNAGVCSSTAAIGIATGTDNCGAPTITNDAPANFPIGNTTVTWTATDGGGNTATCTQIVTVIDNEIPVITCPVDVTINTDAGVCSSTATFGTATGTDNCGAPTITNNAPATFPIGNTTITWTATDGGGNTATCTQVVTVVDAEAPTITCPSNQTVAGDNNCETLVIDYTAFAIVSFSDNCDPNPTITQSPAAGTTLSGSVNTITLTVTDVTGNAGTCTFTVTIIDTTAPVVNCLANQVAVLDGNCEFFLPDYGAISTFSDNCDANLTITQTPVIGTVYTDKENVSVNVTYTDASGNTSVCSFTVDITLNPNNPDCGGELIITTLFTPNGDGKNDTWIVTGLNPNCSVAVYNRWGQEVFESSNYNSDWNGTSNGNILPDGDYYYVITCDDGTAEKGPLTILRTK